MPEQVRVAIIGAGGIGARHLENLRFLGGNQITAICDLDQARAHRLAERVGARTYRTTEDMFAAGEEIEAIVICTPTKIRRQIIDQAAARGIAIYCEKPPAHTVEEGLRIAEIIDRHNVVCCVGFNQRYSPAVDRFREITKGRTANFVQSIAANASLFTHPLEPWFYIQEKSGGQLMDQAIHTFDLLRYVVGEITEVHTFGNNVLRPVTEDFTAHDTTVSSFRFAHGGSGSHIHSWSTPKSRSELLIAGGDYSLSLRAINPPELHGFLGGPGSEQTPVNETWEQGKAMDRFGEIPQGRKPEDPPDPPHFEAMKTFIKATESGDQSQIRSSYLDSLKTLAVILGMLRSAETGEAVHINSVTAPV